MTRTTLDLGNLLTMATLPGPDTSTKADALEFPDPRFRLLLAESARTGWPKAFCNDLFLHDLDYLKRYPQETEMVWILRDHGTHLYPVKLDSRGEAQFVRDTISYHSGDHKLNVADRESDRARYYHLAAGALTPVSPQEALDLITVKQEPKQTNGGT